MTDPATIEQQQRKKPRGNVGLMIVIFLEVLAFAGAVIGFSITDAMGAKANAQALTLAKIGSRQNALIERVAYDLAQIAAAPKDAVRDAAPANDLSTSATLFGQTLAAMKNGGQTTGLDGSTVSIPALTSPIAAQSLQQADSSWNSLSAAIKAATDHGTRASLDEAVRQASVTAPAISDDFNAVVTDTNASTIATTSNKLRDLLEILAIAMVLAMVFTLVSSVDRGRKQLEKYADTLRKSSDEAVNASRALAEAKAGTDLIMSTVDRGLFLIGGDYRIAGEYSGELERIFRTPELSGYNFVNILQRLLTERMFDISRDYLALLFDKSKKERTVLRVNPLAEVEAHFPNPAGGFDTKFLNFTFRRIVSGEDVTRVFVAVSDITDRVRLERQLRESEARKERQFEFLLGVLHVEPKALDDFLATATEQVGVMNDALRASDFATSSAGRMDLLRQRLEVVYRAVHTVKGNAAMLQLAYFTKVCDGFESKIVQLRDRRALGGDDFLSIVMAQAELRQDLEELQELRERFVGIGSANRMPPRELFAAARPAAAPSDLVSNIAAYATEMAAKQGKDVRVVSENFDTELLPESVQRTIKDVVIQLARNSVAHGIETADMRESMGKPRLGTLTLRGLSGAPGDSFAFTFRDDGRGLDPSHIRDRAVAKQLIAPDAAASMTDEQIVALIFRPGFSTAEETTTDAGRGVGMNVIKEAIVDKLGGRLGLNSEPGKFTEFSFTIPLKPAGAKPSTDAVAALAYT
jgi:HPt (histidine-containing phosphotransfer) domain-containing protein